MAGGRSASPADTPTDWARRPGSVKVRAAFQSLAVPVLSRALTPLSVDGSLPRFDGDHFAPGTVYVANHRSHADSLVILRLLGRRRRRRLLGAVAADYFFANRYVGWCSALLLGGVPIDRSRISRRNLDECVRLVGEGWSLLIFPEGGRHSEPGMQPFKAGAALIAQRTSATVVPIHLTGTHAVLPKGASLPRRHRVEVRIGAPLSVGPDESTRRFAERIESAVADLGARPSPLS